MLGRPETSDPLGAQRSSYPDPVHMGFRRLAVGWSVVIMLVVSGYGVPYGKNWFLFPSVNPTANPFAVDVENQTPSISMTWTSVARTFD
jgi:hypothetical protein